MLGPAMQMVGDVGSFLTSLFPAEKPSVTPELPHDLFVICLVSSPEKASRMRARLLTAGLTHVKYISTITPNMPLVDHYAHPEKGLGTEETAQLRKEGAIRASHMKALRFFLETHHASALI